MVGQRHCRMHGGATARSRAKAARTLAQRRAEGEVGRLLAQAYDEVEGMTGIDHLEAGIRRAAAMAVAYETLLAELPKDATWSWDDHYSQEGSRQGRVQVDVEGMLGPDGRGTARLHPYEEGLRYWTKLHGELVKNAAVLGLEERKVAVSAEIHDRIGAAIISLVAGLGRDLNDPAVIPVVETALIAITGGGDG